MNNPKFAFRRKSEDKQREITAAGRRVIFREGIWNTTTRKIAEEAGISLATIHYYFANKDELLVAVYEEMIESIRHSAAEDFAKPQTLAARIAGVIARTWHFSRQHMESQLMQAELTLYALRNGLRPLAIRQGHEYLDIYVRVLQSSSDITHRRDLDILGLAHLILAGVDGFLTQHMVEPDNERTALAFEGLTQVALQYPLKAGRPPITALTVANPPKRRVRTQ